MKFRAKIIQCIVFMLIMTIFFTIGQNLDINSEILQYENLIFIFLGWCLGEVFNYFLDKYKSGE